MNNNHNLIHKRLWIWDGEMIHDRTMEGEDYQKCIDSTTVTTQKNGLP